jgi:hypothetical protein
MDGEYTAEASNIVANDNQPRVEHDTFIDHYLSTLTVAELGKMLPTEINVPLKSGGQTASHTLSGQKAKNVSTNAA